MAETPSSHGVSSFLSRRHSTGDGNVNSSVILPPFPASSPDHVCRQFRAPEGVYTLFHSIFVHSMQPLYTVGTSASLVSIKYKNEDHNNTHNHHEPGATKSRRRRLFSHTNHSNTNNNSNSNNHHSSSNNSSNSNSISNTHLNNINESDEEQLLQQQQHKQQDHEQQQKTPSLSSSSSSNNNSSGHQQHFSPSSPSIPIPSSTTSTTTSHFHYHNDEINTVMPTPTLSFLARSHTLGRYSKKPKSNITKTNSSFVQKIITNDQLAKILIARTSQDTNLFYNCGTSFVWMDASGHPKEPLSRIIFARACPTSHDVNMLTRGVDHLDIIIGFTSGDIMWFDPLCNKYGRINKGGVMNSSAITMIKWLPGYDNLFMAAFQDGSVMLFDKEKEDEHFHPGDGKKSTNTSIIDKAMFKVSKPFHKHATKFNPISHWKLSNRSITAFAFSPDCQHVAIVGLDGLLRVVNILHEVLLDVYESYYGGLTCVAWSPDGKYILTGGQDDLVTIWAFREQRIVARCQGHSSWITDIAFDPWRCDEKIYRFASVGEDGKLILWDFSVNALHKPKTKAGNNNRNRSTSVSSLNNTNGIMASNRAIIHPVPAKTQVAFLQPSMVKSIHGDPCSGVYFREDVIVTTDKRGKVNIWQRPS